MESNDNFYVSQSDKLLKQFDKMTKHTAKSLDLLDRDLTDAIIMNAREEFIKLIPKIPYIGGNENPNTGNIILSAMALSLYRAMQSQGKSIDETGKVILETIEFYVGSYPKLLLRIFHKLGLAPNSPNAKKARNYAEKSQQRKWPFDWVYTYIEGDKSSFNWGTDYSECGIIKFFRKQNAEELTKYLCACDFPLANAYGVHLTRKQTLAEGASFCDFRYK